MCVLNSQALFTMTMLVFGQVDPSLTCWVVRRISLRKTKQRTRRKKGSQGFGVIHYLPGIPRGLELLGLVLNTTKKKRGRILF